MLSKFKQWRFPSPEELKLRKQELQRRNDERKSKSQPEAVTRVSFPSTKPSPLSPILFVEGRPHLHVAGSMLSKFKQWLFPSPEELKLRKQELQRRIDERKSKSQPEAVTRVSFPSTKPSPLSPITLSSPACPYCGVIQEPPPTRRRKCRDCGQVIHVRTDREERKKYLLTAEEAERRATKDARLARERRNEEWRRLSEHVRVAMQAGDWKSLQSAYQQQANILFVEGRPHLHVAQEARRAQLMSLLETSIADVEVRTSDDERVCAHCQSLDRKVFTIQEALETMPIPSPHCTDGNQ